MGLSITLEDPINTNVEYDLTNPPEQYATFGKIKGGVNCSYDFEDTYEGSITITHLDKTKYTVSGIFEFSTKKEGCQDIKITHGRFDVQYTP